MDKTPVRWLCANLCTPYTSDTSLTKFLVQHVTLFSKWCRKIAILTTTKHGNRVSALLPANVTLPTF
ncbi:unnamed protein product [Ixodes persulcatus]